MPKIMVEVSTFSNPYVNQQLGERLITVWAKSTGSVTLSLLQENDGSLRIQPYDLSGKVVVRGGRGEYLMTADPEKPHVAQVLRDLYDYLWEHETAQTIEPDLKRILQEARFALNLVDAQTYHHEEFNDHTTRRE
jgi:hypothetical protein